LFQPVRTLGDDLAYIIGGLGDYTTETPGVIRIVGLDGFPAFLIPSLLFLDGLDVGLRWPCTLGRCIQFRAGACMVLGLDWSHFFARRIQVFGKLVDDSVQFRARTHSADR
jgi:hypothetical protein